MSFFYLFYKYISNKCLIDSKCLFISKVLIESPCLGKLIFLGPADIPPATQQQQPQPPQECMLEIIAHISIHTKYP